jgi:hypothetical protein
MIRVEALLVDGQGAPIKRSGFLQSIGGLEHIRSQSLELQAEGALEENRRQPAGAVPQ